MAVDRNQGPPCGIRYVIQCWLGGKVDCDHGRDQNDGALAEE